MYIFIHSSGPVGLWDELAGEAHANTPAENDYYLPTIGVAQAKS